MTGFELQTSGFGSDRSTNCATTTSHHGKFFFDRIADYVPTLNQKRVHQNKDNSSCNLLGLLATKKNGHY